MFKLFYTLYINVKQSFVIKNKFEVRKIHVH